MEEETLAQVQRLYTQCEALPVADKDLLDMPLDQRLTMPIPTIRRWLDITTPTVHHRCVT